MEQVSYFFHYAFSMQATLSLTCTCHPFFSLNLCYLICAISVFDLYSITVWFVGLAKQPFALCMKDQLCYTVLFQHFPGRLKVRMALSSISILTGACACRDFCKRITRQGNGPGEAKIDRSSTTECQTREHHQGVVSQTRKQGNASH